MLTSVCYSFLFFFNDPSTTDIYTLSLHDALPIWRGGERDEPGRARRLAGAQHRVRVPVVRSEEHTSELQSPYDLVCRLLLEKKKITLLLLKAADRITLF